MLQRTSVFVPLFALYVAGVLVQVLLGLTSALAMSGLPLEGPVRGGLQVEGPWQPILLAIDLAGHAQASADPVLALLDYLLSALNIGFGVFLVWLRPDNWVTRLLGMGMVGTASTFNFQSHTVLLTLPPFLPLMKLHFMYHALSGVAYLHALLLFPNGQLVPRWARWPLIAGYTYAAVEIVAAMVVGYAITPFLFGNLVGLWDFAMMMVEQGLTPEDIPQRPDLFNVGMALTFQAELVFLVAFAGVIMPILGAVSQLYRYGILATARERLQSKLLLYALGLAALVALSFLVLAVGPWPELAPWARLDRLDVALRVFPPPFGIIPLALFVAIVRHHLFDVDVLINRTLVYGTLTAALALAYWASVGLFQGLLRPVTQGSELAIVASTVMVAALFQPLRLRLQDFVDRRFYRQKYDAARTVEAFSHRLREQVDLDSLNRELRTIVQRTMQPAHVSLWVRRPTDRAS